MHEQAQIVVSNVFQTMEFETLQQVMKSVRIIQSPVGQYLCHEGTLERSFFIIVAGEVAVSKRKPDGSQELLQIKKPGDFFGEMALLRNQPRSADVYTTSESVLVEMGIDAFREVISQRPQFLDNLMKLMDSYDANHRKMRRPMIFTSYSRKDHEFVRRMVKDLKNELRGAMLDIWFDQNDIGPGKDWDEAIEEALQKTTAMLLIVSSNATKSKNVKSEWNYCMEEGKIIIPILIDAQCEIPFRLKTYHYIDITNYTDHKNYEEGLERIVVTLRDIAEQSFKQ